MGRKINRRVAVLAVILAACFTLSARCQVTTSSARDADKSRPFHGVVVLQDGGTLCGAIVRDGERCVVIGDGSEIIVADSSIDFIAHSLRDAYERKRAAARSNSADARLEVAQWCLRNDLLAEAKIELRAARQLDARHPRLPLLQRRLAVAEQQSFASPRRSVASTAGAEAVPVPASAAYTSHKSASASSNDVDRFDLLVSDLPPGAVERFTRKIQPVLVNSCATAGCHQVGSSLSFQLDRSLLHDMANRRSTMQNLSATLALVDRRKPEESPLLTVPRRAHGGMEKAVFGPRDAKLLVQLTEWVALVTQDAAQDDEAPAEQGPSDRSVLTSASKDTARFADSMEDRPATLQETATLRPSSQIRYGAVLRPVEPRDEFDPEIFNRRYGADSRAEQPKG